MMFIFDIKKKKKKKKALANMNNSKLFLYHRDF